MPVELPELLVADLAAWRRWLVAHAASSPGVWLVLGYAVLYRVSTAKRPDTRARRIEQLVAMIARGDTLHPGR